MRLNAFIFLCCCLLLTAGMAGCRSDTAQQSNSPQPSASQSAASTPQAILANNNPAQVASNQAPVSNASNAMNSTIDSCSLLTASDIQAVQGQALKDTKSSHQTDGAFAVSQCYYLTAEPSKSVVLSVYRNNDEHSSAQSPRDFWKERFGSAVTEEKEREREKKKAQDKDHDQEAERAREKARKGEVEEGESAPPKRVTGVGDEAFWTGNQIVGALYVLKKNNFIRISIGGADDAQTKIRKSKALAQKALSRL